MKRLRTSQRFRLYKVARKELSRVYPAAFPARGRRRPLKIGILKDIICDGSHGLPAGQVRVFLSIWTRSTSYLESVARGKERIGLDGTPCSAVEESHAVEARAAVDRRRSTKPSGKFDAAR